MLEARPANSDRRRRAGPGRGPGASLTCRPSFRCVSQGTRGRCQGEGRGGQSSDAGQTHGRSRSVSGGDSGGDSSQQRSRSHRGVRRGFPRRTNREHGRSRSPQARAAGDVLRRRREAGTSGPRLTRAGPAADNRAGCPTEMAPSRPDAPSAVTGRCVTVTAGRTADHRIPRSGHERMIRMPPGLRETSILNPDSV